MSVLLGLDILFNFMVGLIWTVQMVHYPMFIYGKGDDEFFNFHARRFALIMIPLMLVEMALSVTLLFFTTLLYLKVLFWVHFIFNVVIWIESLVFQIPDHHRVKKHFSEEHVQVLIHHNWYRTVLWTSKALLAFVIVLSSLL